MRRTGRVVGAAVASAALVATTSTAPADATYARAHGPGRGVAPVDKEVAQDLNNPRQIAFGPNGAMYVAEAGYGDFKGIERARCFLGGEGGTVCFGATGSVTRVLHGKQHRVLK